MMSKIIKENWAAIEAIEAELKEQKGDPQAGFNASLFFAPYFFKQREFLIPCEFRKKTKTGFTQKRYTVYVRASYCPFTGKKLFNDE